MCNTAANAQSFKIETDTIRHSTDGYFSLLNRVTNYTPGDLILRWNVLATNYPLELQHTTCLCDNYGCNHDSTFFTGGAFQSTYPAGNGEMHLMGDVSTLTDPGPYYISLLFLDRGSSTNRDTATFIINKVPPTPPTPAGIATEQAGGGLSVFPNPANGAVVLRFNGTETGEATITISAISGAVVKRMQQAVKPGANVVPLSLNELPNGMYTICLHMPNGSRITTKLTVNAN